MKIHIAYVIATTICGFLLGVSAGVALRPLPENTPHIDALRKIASLPILPAMDEMDGLPLTLDRDPANMHNWTIEYARRTLENAKVEP